MSDNTKLDLANNKGGIQGHSQGDHFPATIVQVGGHAELGNENVAYVLHAGEKHGPFNTYGVAASVARNLVHADEFAAKVAANELTRSARR